MNESSNQTRADAGRGVLDPAWEDELRRAQEAEGEAGSVDAELAFVHLLRHARAPEELEAAQLDAIWSDIDAAITPEPWWRKAWVWWTAPALAAAAVLFVVVVEPGAEDASSVAQAEEAIQFDARAKHDASAADKASGALEDAAEEAPAPAPTATAEKSKRSGASGALAKDAEASRSAQGSAAETYFKQLAPNGRRAIRVSVDQSRDMLRAQLLDTSRTGG